MKKAANEQKVPTGKKKEDPAKLAAQKEAAQKEKLNDIEEKFFKHVATEENDIATIKARALLKAEAAEEEESPAK